MTNGIPELAFPANSPAVTCIDHRFRLQLINDGENFYKDMQNEIEKARYHIEMECYILEPGKVADCILGSLTERAKAGVRVRLLADRIGSKKAVHTGLFKSFRAAGGNFHWYRPLLLRTPLRINSRNHRNILTIDNHIGFTGSAGVSDRWLYQHERIPHWRDSVTKVVGRPVEELQAAFDDNWREVVSGRARLSISKPKRIWHKIYVNDIKTSQLLVVKDGLSMRHSLTVFHDLIGSAQRTICITTPYFLPDEALIKAFKKAAARGVNIKIVTAGKHSDHTPVQWAARCNYRQLLQPAIEIHEYIPTMIHAKIMVVDGIFTAFGTSNIDTRSFIYNDEIDLLIQNPDFAGAVQQAFEIDRLNSRKISPSDFSSPLYTSRPARAITGLFKLFA